MTERELATLWADIEALKRPSVRRFELGRRFFELRQKYSERERKSGGPSAAAGHGEFEAQCIARGWAPRTVRDLIADFQIERQRMADPYAEPWAKTSAEKRRERRRSRRKSQELEPSNPLAEFAALLPFEAAQAAYRTAARIYHPDCGGDTLKMQQLNAAWARAKSFYEALESVKEGMRAVIARQHQ